MHNPGVWGCWLSSVHAVQSFAPTEPQSMVKLRMPIAQPTGSVSLFVRLLATWPKVVHRMVPTHFFNRNALGGAPCDVRKVGCFPPPVTTGPRILNSAPYSPCWYTRDFFF